MIEIKGKLGEWEEMAGISKNILSKKAQEVCVSITCQSKEGIKMNAMIKHKDYLEDEELLGDAK